jgi:uncharacterized protein (TIGR02284 family)
MKKQINPEGIIQMLNELSETCRHGKHGFEVAAERLASTSVKSFFFEQSRVRAQFSADLHEEMRNFNLKDGDDRIKENGNAVAFTVSDLVETEEESGIVAACRKADELAIRRYEQALTHPLPATLRSVIEYQYRSIKQAHDQMKMWDRRDGA